MSSRICDTLVNFIPHQSSTSETKEFIINTEQVSQGQCANYTVFVAIISLFTSAT